MTMVRKLWTPRIFFFDIGIFDCMRSYDVYHHPLAFSKNNLGRLIAISLPK